MGGVNFPPGAKADDIIMVDEERRHRPVRIFPLYSTKKKWCAFCHVHKIRTKSGYPTQTIFKCELCDVPLCTGDRNCFVLYHMNAGLTHQPQPD